MESSARGARSGATGYADRAQPPTPPKPPSQPAEVVDKIQEKGKDVAGQVQERAFAQAADQLGKVSENLGSVAEAARSAGAQLRQKDQGFVAQYVDQAAEQIDRFAGYLEHKQPDELLGDAESFARRQPVLFLGGAFALGVLAARFLKSTSAPSARSRSYDYRNPYESGYAVGRPEAQPPRYGPTV